MGRHHRKNEWPDDRVQLMRKLWLTGLGATKIARELGEGMTRDAVTAKASRLGLETRKTRPKTTTRPRQRNLDAKPLSAGPEPKQRAFRDIIETPGRVGRLEDLERGDCHWPIGDPKSSDFSFCGETTETTYCSRHRKRAYREETKPSRLERLSKH